MSVTYFDTSPVSFSYDGFYIDDDECPRKVYRAELSYSQMDGLHFPAEMEYSISSRMSGLIPYVRAVFQGFKDSLTDVGNLSESSKTVRLNVNGFSAYYNTAPLLIGKYGYVNIVSSSPSSRIGYRLTYHSYQESEFTVRKLQPINYSKAYRGIHLSDNHKLSTANTLSIEIKNAKGIRIEVNNNAFVYNSGHTNSVGVINKDTALLLDLKSTTSNSPVAYMRFYVPDGAPSKIVEYRFKSKNSNLTSKWFKFTIMEAPYGKLITQTSDDGSFIGTGIVLQDSPTDTVTLNIPALSYVLDGETHNPSTSSTLTLAKTSTISFKHPALSRNQFVEYVLDVGGYKKVWKLSGGVS